MILCQIMPMDSPFLFPLPCHNSLSSDRTQDLDLMIYISGVPPVSSHYDFLSWTELEDIDLPIYIQCFPFRQTITSNDTSLYSIIDILNLPLLVVWVPS